jgi:dolichyl-phosphate beta-glucosyltransferase
MVSDSAPTFSIIIPAFNEERRIGRTLEQVGDYLKRRSLACELVIVNDGSTDRTAEVVENSVTRFSPDRFVIHDLGRNCGKGLAIKEGMLRARGEYVVFMDADLATPIEEFDKILAEAESRWDVLVGSRKAKGASQVETPLYRKFLGKGFSLLAKKVLSLNVHDVTCGFKCYRRRAVQEIFPRQRLKGWVFDAEDLFLARKFGLVVKEFPVRWRHSEESKVRVARDIVKSSWELVQIRINDLRGLYR